VHLGSTSDDKLSSNDRAEKLLGQLHQWAMEAVEQPREERTRFIIEVAGRYYEDALGNGLSEAQAEAWRESVNEWLHALVHVIETSGGGGGGRA
jgi:hypothetical protein